MSATPSLTDRARDLVEQLEANGAAFSYKPAEGTLPASFNYALPKGGDRWKCRGLVAEAKADAQVWHELVAEVGRRCNGGAK